MLLLIRKSIRPNTSLRFRLNVCSQTTLINIRMYFSLLSSRWYACAFLDFSAIISGPTYHFAIELLLDKFCHIWRKVQLSILRKQK